MTQADKPYEVRIGARILRFEPPDLYLSLRDGDVSVTELKEAARAWIAARRRALEAEARAKSQGPFR